MGQAKNRKVEINALKNSPQTLTKVFALRHGRDGDEFVCFGVVLENPMYNKKTLLEAVSCTAWGHNAPVALIADYLVQTNTYAVVNKFNPFGYFIEFYHDDPDSIGTHSCRTICGFRTEENFDSYVAEVLETVDTSKTDVKYYA